MEGAATSAAFGAEALFSHVSFFHLVVSCNTPFKDKLWRYADAGRGQYDTRPRFFIVGGLVFQPLSPLA